MSTKCLSTIRLAALHCCQLIGDLLTVSYAGKSTEISIIPVRGDSHGALPWRSSLFQELIGITGAGMQLLNDCTIWIVSMTAGRNAMVR